jgi:hypothetical protein
MKIQDYPKISDLDQDEKHGFLVDIQQAIQKNEISLEGVE